MRQLDEIMKTGRQESPFSNGTEGHEWMANWCYECHTPAEAAWRRYEEGKRKTEPKEFPGGCPLILAALNGVTPTEWMEQPDRPFGDQFHCIEYRDEDGGDGRGGNGEPRPRPEPTNMDGLFERPERGTRMLTPYQSEAGVLA